MSFNDFQLSFLKMSLSHFREHILKYCIAIVSLIFLHWIQVQVPVLIIKLSQNNESINFKELIGHFILVALGIIFFRTLSRWFFFFPARVQQKELRNQLVHMLSLCSPIHWKKYSIGKLYEILISDLEEIRVFFGFALLQIINLIIALVILFPAMSKVSNDLMWSLFPLGLCFLLFSLSLIFTTSLSEKGRHEHDILQQILVEFYDAKKTLNVFCKERSAVAEFNDQSTKELELFFKVNLMRSITRPLILLGGGLSLVLAAYLVRIHHYPMTYLIAYSAFIFLLYEPLGYLSWIGIIITETRVSWKRITLLVNDLLKENDDVSKNFSLHDGVINFHFTTEHLSQTVSFDIGSKYLFIGPTASGKSTFFESIHYAALKQKRSSVLVPQDPYLFNQNIENNLFLNIPLTTELRNKALYLLKIFDLEDIALFNQDLLSVSVGEKGKKLSGGQVKRLHMIRSLLFPYELIIWDDPFSSLDVLTEKKILTEILYGNSYYLKGKTFFLTTHRLSTVKYFNNVICSSRKGLDFGELSNPLWKARVDEFFRSRS